MKLRFLRNLMTLVLVFSASLLFAQVTTSGINGKVTGTGGATLPGATVVIVHVPSGSTYGTTTDINGFYRLPNMNVGGPYTLSVSYVGYETWTKEGIFLSLGQVQKINASISEKSSQLTGVEIKSDKSSIIDGNRTGAETQINRENIDRMPTIARNITDFTRLTPQARVTQNGGVEIAGMSNKYNAIFIDGAVNNDVFGLSETGTNGGQTGISPFSMDIIDQFNVSIAPFDVKLGGFAGAGINAVTRRGDNEFKGSAYYFFRNQSLAGKTPTDDPEVEPTKLPDFSSKTYGVRVGGPIIKDKLFFFANFEMQKDETPSPFLLSSYGGTTDVAKLDQLIAKIKSYDYDPGVYNDATKKLEGTKIFARIDWNINANHKMLFRHQYTNAKNTSPYVSSKSNLYFSNSGVYFPSTTNSSALELKSIFGNKYANNLILGATFVRDDRDPMGQDFPFVAIKDGTSYIRFGSEEFSTGNQLNQDVITLTDNFDWYLGKHSITIGTHNEFTKNYNLFIRQNYGSYQFASIDDFINDSLATQYDRSFSLIDGITGDGSKAATEFNTLQLGFYVQDDYQVMDNLKITGGIRVDIPMFLTDPTLNAQFNDNVLDSIRMEMADKTYAPYLDAQTGQAPGAQFMISPRVGFNWDVFNNQKTQVRGGIGIFTSRLPFVWPGGMYNNNGMMIGGVRKFDVAFNPDWSSQIPTYDPSASIKPSGQIDLFSKDFKYPQVLRGSLAVDQKLPGGFIGTLDFTFTKNMNNIMYYNFRYKQTGTITNGGDERPIWGVLDVFKKNHSGYNYTDIIYAYNTSEGKAYNITAQLQHNGWKGLSGSIAYTFGAAESMNDGVSSQNSSQWRVPNVNGKNMLDLATSDYDMGSRFIGFLNYKVEYANHLATTIGLVYNGQSGQRYSYGYADGGKSPNLLGEDNQALELMYVPVDETDINLVDIKDADGNVTLSAAQQWTDLNDFITNDEYLNTRRGMYAERNSSRTPFEHIFDLHIAQDLYIQAGGKRNTLQLTFDVFNLGNLISADFGRRYFVSGYYGNYSLIKFKGFEADGTTPKFTYEKPKGEIWSIDDSGLLSSRWQAQIGIRYIFN